MDGFGGWRTSSCIRWRTRSPGLGPCRLVTNRVEMFQNKVSGLKCSETKCIGPKLFYAIPDLRFFYKLYFIWKCAITGKLHLKGLSQTTYIERGDTQTLHLQHSQTFETVLSLPGPPLWFLVHIHVILELWLWSPFLTFIGMMIRWVSDQRHWGDQRELRTMEVAAIMQ